MGFKVRSSKFRHVYGEAHRKDQCYENVSLTRHAHDGNFCCVNPKFVAMVTEAAGGGAFLVLPISQTGRIPINAPKVCGHASAVLDIKWNPFKDNVIASCSEDCTIKVWQIPENGLLTNLSDWQIDLHGHGRRVAYIDWHPTAENIILSSGLDYKVYNFNGSFTKFKPSEIGAEECKPCQTAHNGSLTIYQSENCIIWNIEQAEPVNIIDCHTEPIFSMSWNRDGSLFSTTSKDKMLRLIDPRAGKCVQESQNIFDSVRPTKNVFLGDTGKIFCTGFSRSGHREVGIWDIRNMQKYLAKRSVDNSNGILIPYYDHDTRIVFIAGKGDGNISYYEMTDTDPYMHFLNSYGSSAPQRGLGVMPKRGCSPEKCEIMRFYKLHAARNFVEPVSMIVPRKSNLFHEDLFPPTTSTIPSLTADEWISGQNREPILISMKDKQVVNDPKVTPSVAVRCQDGALNQAPTITTYKAMTSQQVPSTSASSLQSSKPEVKKTPASLKNIKQLSTSDDIITLQPKKEPELNSEKVKEEVPETTNVKIETEKESDTVDRVFVNSKIAAFENKGVTNVNENAVTSPRRRSERKSWSSAPDNPPDLIANGMKGNSLERGRDSSPLTVRNAAQFFEHKEIQIIDLVSETSVEEDKNLVLKDDNKNVSEKKPSKPDLQLSTEYSNGNQLLSQSDKNRSGGHKIHIKKTWSPIKPPSNPIWEDNSAMPNTDPELRKAYFRQVEEIRALKEQMSLKDKRIRQLEDEITILRKGGPSSIQGESDC